jgi:hypothetical protein
MTIYLPYPDFRRSAKCLTNQHLDEQRRTVRRLIQEIVVLQKDDSEWSNHVSTLLQICDATLDERRRRKIDERGVTPWMLDHGDPPPPWLGDPKYHEQHRRALMHLDPGHYGRMKWR